MAAGACAWPLPELNAANRLAGRQFHASLSVEAIEQDPELLPTVARAGVGTVWLDGFFYGHWPYGLPRVLAARAQAERLGLRVFVINIPLGHPGDSLGSSNGNFPITPPARWKMAYDMDNKVFVGTSLHEPATAENVQALTALRQVGFRQFFLDDDFRLARGPGQIGGCFCAEHRARFLRRQGYAEARWPELLADVHYRQLTRLTREWVDFTAAELTACFREQSRAAGEGNLGIMVMYLGAEKAGIRLGEYRDVPFRVGELMFNDAAFAPVKGKTDELFSALMHRRFCRPEMAFSETTAFPANNLSAPNLAAKLVVSTIADVRHTMFMSGLTPFPRAHWDVLAPAMREQAAIHRVLAGHRPYGPFKHFWGEASRYVGNDQPFSLFLATGVPFEVVETPTREGWVFLSDADAEHALTAGWGRHGSQFICHAKTPYRPANAIALEESLPALMNFKAEIMPQLRRVPHVVEAVPVVCAWYPTARSVLLWNLSEEKIHCTLRHGRRDQAIELAGLKAQLVET